MASENCLKFASLFQKCLKITTFCLCGSDSSGSFSCNNEQFGWMFKSSGHRGDWIKKLISHPDVNALWKVIHLHKPAYITSLCVVWPVGLLCIRSVTRCEGKCVTQWARVHSPRRIIQVFSPTANPQPRWHGGRTRVCATPRSTATLQPTSE